MADRVSTTFQGVPVTHYKSNSNKAPIVFSVGFGSTIPQYDKFLSELANDVDVFALELNGVNPNSKLISDSSQVLNSFIQENALQGSHLIGHSRGTGISSTYAYGTNDDVSSLTVINPAISLSLGDLRHLYGFNKSVELVRDSINSLQYGSDIALRLSRLALPAMKTFSNILGLGPKVLAQGVDAFFYELEGERDFPVHVIRSKSDVITPTRDFLINGMFGLENLVISDFTGPDHGLPISIPRRTKDKIKEEGFIFD